MFPQAIAVALDGDNHRVMQQAIQEGSGNDRIAENLTSLFEAAVGGQNHGTFFIASIDQLEEEARSPDAQRQIANFIPNEQCLAGEKAQALGQLAGPLLAPSCPRRPLGERFAEVVSVYQRQTRRLQGVLGSRLPAPAALDPGERTGSGAVAGRVSRPATGGEA